MTSQVGERLIYEGHEVSMCSEPLRDFFSLGGKHPEFAKTRTSILRRYVGTWEIVNDRLCMVRLTGKLEDSSEATLESNAIAKCVLCAVVGIFDTLSVFVRDAETSWRA